VAYTLARAFLECGFAVLRFNFRGTENSEGTYDDGVGEIEDARAALAWMRQKFQQESAWLGGFSFGAAVAIKTAIDEPLDGLISIAPAVSRFASGLTTQPACPWLVLIGDQDELVSVDEIVEWVDSLAPGPELLVMPGAEHFFHGRLVEMRQTLVDFIQRTERS
jgi:alpha/beta superfamily hydrolase